MGIVKTPPIVSKILPQFQWRINTDIKEVFLTFDDGPTPYVTEWVLDQLDEFNAKATFFLIGRNVLKYPKIAQEIINRGHSVGNHTFSHLSGWTCNQKEYLHEIELTDLIFEATLGIKSKLFRPPYGRLNFYSTHLILATHVVVMWDILARDFDPSLTAQQCINNVLNNYKIGSTIVFHDSLKCESRLKPALPIVLSYFRENNYSLQKISI